ncbi:hypothetical protein R2226_003367 [Cronobacter sakazakii]|nr:hypothetical protein [Cronobacter sakazakii]
MNKTSPIDRLISATRLNDTVRANPELYETTILRLKSIAEQLGLPLDVKVVYSSSRRVEHITISGMVWLIYDQYQGQTMNMLNRLFIEAEDAHPSLVYFHKVLAERLVDAGQLANALHCAAAYHSSREVLRSRSSDYTWRNVLTKTHERFLLYHEFGHRIFSNPALMPVIREHVQFLIQHQAQVTRRPLKTILRSMRKAPSAARHHQNLKAAIRDLRLEYESEEGRYYRQAQLSSLAQPQTEEEVFCDVFASDFVLMEGLNDGDDLIKVLRAIYVGLYHLQALEYLRRFPSLTNDSTDWLTDKMPHIQLRSHCLRAHLIFLYQTELRVKQQLDDNLVADSIRAFEIQLMEDQKRHYDVIYDSAIRLCDSLRRNDTLPELGRETMARLQAGLQDSQSTSTPLPTDDELKKIILIFTGWLP